MNNIANIVVIFLARMVATRKRYGWGLYGIAIFGGIATSLVLSSLIEGSIAPWLE